MAGATASIIFSTLALFAICILVLLLLRRFLPLRATPLYLLVPIFLALVLPISTILLVPIDLASSLRTEDEVARGIWLPSSTVLVVWRITYWLTFALTWIVLPILGEYLDSGYRTPKQRLLYSLRSNGRYQLIVMASGIAGLTYIGLTSGFGKTSIKALVMALAYCWGLVLAIYLMGHGLVALPRRLIRDADSGRKLRRIQSQAPKAHGRLTTAIAELDDLEQQVRRLQIRKNAISPYHQEWVADIAEDSPLEHGRPDLSERGSSAPPAIITDRYLAELARKVARARHKQTRFSQEWSYLVHEATATRQIIDASASKQLSFNAPTHTVPLFTPYTRYIFHVKVAPSARLAFAVLLILASASIVFSELVKALRPHLTIISLTVYRSSGGPSRHGSVPLTGQIISCLWLLYMCAAALTSVNDVKVWGNRALVRRYTYGESATWYSAQVAKLTVPLAYNFVTLFPRDVHRETGFYQVLGRLVDLTPLGKGFDYFFPMFILVPVCATLFNLYGRARNIIGMGLLGWDDDDDEEAYGGWMEGRDLIAQDQAAPSLHADPDPPSFSPYTDTASSGPAGPPQSQSSTTRRPLTSSPSQTSFTTSRAQATRLAAATQAAEEAEEAVFSGFAHRVRNTFDTMDKPDWLADLGSRKPKWMMAGGGPTREGDSSTGGWGAGGAGEGAQPEPSSSSRGGFLKFFGGSARDGQVRL